MAHLRSLASAWILSGLLAGCATEQGATSLPIVIPVGELPPNGDAGLLHQYYRSIFLHMRDALQGGTRESLRELRFLLLQHRREGMASFAQEQLERFELLADGLEFELDLPDHCSVVPDAARPKLHAPELFHFTVKAWEGRRLELGGERTVGIQVRVKARDFDMTGQFLESSQAITLEVPEHTELFDGQELDLKFKLPAAPPHTVMRDLRIVVEMLPGTATWA